MNASIRNSHRPSKGTMLSERAASLSKGFSLGGTTAMGKMLAAYLFFVVFDFLAIASGVSLARLISVLYLIIAALNAPKMRFRVDGLLLAEYGMLFFSMLSLLALTNPASGFNTLSSIWINVLVLIAATSFPYSKQDIRLCEGALIANALLMCVLMFVSSGTIAETSERTVVELFGSQQDANEFCGYFIFAAAMFGYWALKKDQYLLLIPLAVIFYVVMLTGSRGGLLGVAVGVCLGVLFAFKERNYKIFYSVLLCFIVILVIVFFDDILALLPSSVAERYLDVSLTSGTGGARTRAWRNVLEAFMGSGFVRQLFGHGFGATTAVTFNGLVAHNAFLEMLYSCGIFGLTAYLGCIVFAFMRALGRGDSVAMAAIVGSVALVMSLSAVGFKPFWAVLMVASIQVNDGMGAVEALGGMSQKREHGSAESCNIVPWSIPSIDAGIETRSFQDEKFSIAHLGRNA